MAENPKYDLRGAKFGGGFAAEGGTQTGGTLNDFSQNIEQNIHEIDSLLQALRSQAENFPEGIRQETLDHIADLETDIQQPPEQRKPSRIKATLLALAGMLTVISGAVAGANEFATNLQELSEKLGVPLPIEQVHPQQKPDAIDVKAINTDTP